MAKGRNEISASTLPKWDKYIGTIGTIDRDEYEYELCMDILWVMIKKQSKAKKRNLTQEIGSTWFAPKFLNLKAAQISDNTQPQSAQGL